MAEVDVMQEKIKEWKEAHKGKPRDFDLDMLIDVLKVVNDSSAVKVARNPLDEDRDWNPDTTCYNVGNVELDDQGRFVLRLRTDKKEMSVEDLSGRISRLRKKSAGLSSAVMCQVSEKKCVQLTDVYSHALVKNQWAGLPFDVVLAYYEKDEKAENAEEAEKTE